METLVPAFLVLHIFGMLLWFGTLLVQYVFLSEMLASDNIGTIRYSMDLIHRTNRTFVNVGLAISILTGALIIAAHGMEWFRPRMFIHLKITLGLVAAGLSHIGMARIRKMIPVIHAELLTDVAKQQFRQAISTWRTTLTATVAILATMVILAIFKFGTP